MHQFIHLQVILLSCIAGLTDLLLLQYGCKSLHGDTEGMSATQGTSTLRRGKRSSLQLAHPLNLSMALAGRPRMCEGGSSTPSFQCITCVAGSQMLNVHLLKILPATALHNLGFHWKS